MHVMVLVSSTLNLKHVLNNCMGSVGHPRSIYISPSKSRWRIQKCFKLREMDSPRRAIHCHCCEGIGSSCIAILSLTAFILLFWLLNSPVEVVLNIVHVFIVLSSSSLLVTNTFGCWGFCFVIIGNGIPLEASAKSTPQWLWWTWRGRITQMGCVPSRSGLYLPSVT